MSGSEDEEGFLRRWSRRKAEAREGQDQPEAESPASESGEPVEPPAPPEDLPDPETLDADSDFSVFLREGVPDELRSKALRILWRSDPVLANLDGLNDYDGDFTIASRTIGEAVKTAWRIGKGYATEEEEEGAEAEDGEAEEAGGEDDASALAPEDGEDGNGTTPSV